MALGKIEGNTVLDSNGNPVSGAVIRFYEVGTLTPRTIYSDQGQSISLGTFLTTDSAGRFNLAYTNNPYKIRIEQSTSDNTLLYEQDHIGQDVADINAQTSGILTISNVQNSVGTFATSTGAGNAYALTLSQAITSYSEGQFFKFKANHTNTGASTINISAVGVVDLQSNTGAALAAGEIVQDGVYGILYDGGAFKLINSQGTINSGNLTIENGTNPYLELYSSSGDTDRNRLRISATESNLEFQIRNAGGTLITNDYRMDFVDGGATFHEWKISGTSKLQLDSSKLSVIDAVHVDTINEYTTDTGVSADGVLLKDGEVKSSRIYSDASITFDIDVDNSAADNYCQIRRNGTDVIFNVDDVGHVEIRTGTPDSVCNIIRENISNAVDARLWYEISHASSVGGASTRIARFGAVSSTDDDIYVVNESSGGHLRLNTNGGDLYKDNNIVWHEANDGASSGLDADLLDGQQGSYYQNADNINAGTISNDRLPFLTGSYTPIVTNLSGGVIPITSVEYAEYEKVSNLCHVNIALRMGASPLADEVRMTLPFAAATNRDQSLGECWKMFSDTTYPTLTEVLDHISTDGSSGAGYTSLNHGSGHIRGDYFYFDNGTYSSIASNLIDEEWLFLTFLYRAA